jgi:hypothetical protein
MEKATSRQKSESGAFEPLCGEFRDLRSRPADVSAKLRADRSPLADKVRTKREAEDGLAREYPARTSLRGHAVPGYPEQLLLAPLASLCRVRDLIGRGERTLAHAAAPASATHIPPRAGMRREEPATC